MNAGKIFEGEIKDSVQKHNKEENDIYILRLTDSASGFGMDSNATRFSAKSPFDFLFHKRNGITIAAELKSTIGTSISFSLTDEKSMIKASQIKNLKKTNFYGIKSGFLFNFRKFEKTFWIDFVDFVSFTDNTAKKSINIKDVEEYGGIIIPQHLKKVKYLYDIDLLFEGENNV